MLLFCPACFGFGAAVLIHLLVRTALAGRSWINLFTILGWFFGNGAGVVATMLPRNPDEEFGMSHAGGIILLSYVASFGVTIGLNALFAAPELVRAMREVMGSRHVEILLLVLRYEQSFEEAATKLGISVEEAHQLFMEAHKIIGRLGGRYFGRRSSGRRTSSAEECAVARSS